MIKDQIYFSKKYTKLSKDRFTRVCWLDSKYILGGIYDIIYVANNFRHDRFPLGKVRLTKIEIKKMSELSDEFIKEDSDCTRDEFFQIMAKWYSKKPGWKGWDSEIQILRLGKC